MLSKTSFAPRSKNDRLRIELQRLGMPRREAQKTIEKWCEEDPLRVDWHMRLTRTMIRNKKIRVSPLALLRAGISRDYRSTNEGDMQEIMDDLRKREIKRTGPRVEGPQSMNELMVGLRKLYKEDSKAN